MCIHVYIFPPPPPPPPSCPPFPYPPPPPSAQNFAVYIDNLSAYKKCGLAQHIVE